MLTFAGVFTLGEPPPDPPALDQVALVLGSRNPAPLRRIERDTLTFVWHEDSDMPALPVASVPPSPLNKLKRMNNLRPPKA